MKNILLAGFVMHLFFSFGQKSGEQLCSEYISGFQPRYIDGKDTLVVARLPECSNELKRYIDACIKNNDFSPLKYAYVAIYKLDQEHLKVNSSSYLILESDPNPFIRLTIAHMKQKEEVIGDVFYFEALIWIYQHRKEVKGFNKVIKKYLNY